MAFLKADILESLILFGLKEYQDSEPHAKLFKHESMNDRRYELHLHHSIPTRSFKNAFKDSRMEGRSWSPKIGQLGPLRRGMRARVHNEGACALSKTDQEYLSIIPPSFGCAPRSSVLLNSWFRRNDGKAIHTLLCGAQLSPWVDNGLRRGETREGPTASSR